MAHPAVRVIDIPNGGLSAARNVAPKAMGKGDSRPQGWTFRPAPGNQLTHVSGLPLGTRGGIEQHRPAASARYVENLPSHAKQAERIGQQKDSLPAPQALPRKGEFYRKSTSD